MVKVYALQHDHEIAHELPYGWNGYLWIINRNNTPKSLLKFLVYVFHRWVLIIRITLDSTFQSISPIFTVTLYSCFDVAAVTGIMFKIGMYS